jgi:hypothetical protein
MHSVCDRWGLKVKKPRGRPFEPGNKFGRGRPKGSRTRDTAPAKKLLEEYTPHLTRKLIALALEGNGSALRICMERIMPPPRDACVPITLPKIKSAEDVASAAEKVTKGIGNGVLSPSEGETIMNILESQSRVIENAGTEKRVQKLEDHLATAKKPDSR